ncbi:MAG: hypothetical protein K6L81_18080 [Agarilytica sp.]
MVDKKLKWLFAVVIFEAISFMGLTVFWFFYGLIPEARVYYHAQVSTTMLTSIAVIVFSFLTLRQHKYGVAGVKAVFWWVLVLLVYGLSESTQTHLNFRWSDIFYGFIAFGIFWVPVGLGLYWLRGEKI